MDLHLESRSIRYNIETELSVLCELGPLALWHLHNNRVSAFAGLKLSLNSCHRTTLAQPCTSRLSWPLPAENQARPEWHRREEAHATHGKESGRGNSDDGIFDCKIQPNLTLRAAKSHFPYTTAVTCTENHTRQQD